MRARQLALHHSTKSKLSRLKRDAEHEGAFRVAKRLHAVLLNAEDYTSGSIARILDAPLSKVSEWLRNYERYGYEALLEGHRSGRPPELSAEHLLRLADIIESGPVAYGYLSGVWTSPMLSRVIAEEFHCQYHPGHVRKLLHEIGFSVQRPKRMLARANPAAQNKWHRYTYPNLKKKPPPKGPR
jgi:transposase